MTYAHHHLHIIAYTIMLMLTGFSLQYWIGKRRFKRRTIAGLQKFKNYRSAVIVSG